MLDEILKQLEALRNRKQNSNEPPDYIIRVCEAIVAEKAGYKDRMEWSHLQKGN